MFRKQVYCFLSAVLVAISGICFIFKPFFGRDLRDLGGLLVIIATFLCVLGFILPRALSNNHKP